MTIVCFEGSVSSFIGNGTACLLGLQLSALYNQFFQGSIGYHHVGKAYIKVRAKGLTELHLWIS
jgi:hypothetical protein